MLLKIGIKKQPNILNNLLTVFCLKKLKELNHNYVDILINLGDQMLELIMGLDIRCLLCSFVGHFIGWVSVMKINFNIL
jgi:hypothetical protein